MQNYLFLFYAFFALLASNLVNAEGQIVITSKMRGIVSGRFDPVMSPGVVSQHAHRVLGSANFDVTYDPAKLRAASCSNLHSQADKSNYWHPMIYKVVVGDDGKWQYAPMYSRTRIYYNFPVLKKGSGVGTYLEPFPESFQMVAGDPYKKVGDRYMQEDMSIFFYCFKNDASGKDISYQTGSLPTDGCANLVSKVFFPTCWNGQPFNLEKPWDHVKYPVIGGGLFGDTCPEGYEHRIPGILIETFHFGSYDFGPAPSYGGNGDSVPTYIMANGDTTGFGLHADFQNGWDMDVLKRVVSECDNPPFSEPAYEACPALKDTWSYDEGDACNLSPDTLVPNEDIGWEGYLDALPGCNPPWANGTKPTCENYVETTFVPWTRHVGAEDNETPSAAELAKAPVNDGAVVVNNDLEPATSAVVSATSAPASSAPASSADSAPATSATNGAIKNITKLYRIPLKQARLRTGRFHKKISRALSGRNKARMAYAKS